MPFVDFPNDATANEKSQIIHEAMNIYDRSIGLFKLNELIEITEVQSRALYRLNAGVINIDTCINHALTMSDFVISSQRINYIQDLIESADLDPIMAVDVFNLLTNG